MSETDAEQIMARLRELGLVTMLTGVKPDGSFVAFLDIEGHRVGVYRFPHGTRPKVEDLMGMPHGTATGSGKWAWFIGWDDDINEELATGQEKPYAMCTALIEDPVLGAPRSAEDRAAFDNCRRNLWCFLKDGHRGECCDNATFIRRRLSDLT